MIFRTKFHEVQNVDVNVFIFQRNFDILCKNVQKLWVSLGVMKEMAGGIIIFIWMLFFYFCFFVIKFHFLCFKYTFFFYNSSNQTGSYQSFDSIILISTKKVCAFILNMVIFNGKFILFTCFFLQDLKSQLDQEHIYNLYQK